MITLPASSAIASLLLLMFQPSRSPSGFSGFFAPHTRPYPPRLSNSRL
jgi:hypothetical protein